MPPVLTIPRTVSRGDREKTLVRLIQEWLTLNERRVLIDGLFGPATEAAVKEFQSATGLTATGRVDRQTFSNLVKPMSNALASIPQPPTLHSAVLNFVEKHLQARAREAGGNNMGPWVRLYMDDNEGQDWPWCAGFVSFCIKQAAGAMNVSVPVRKTFSCDVLAEWGKENGSLVRGNSSNLMNRVRPGHIFLVRKSPTDWVHTGFVTSLSGEYCQTIEGNTNDEGSRDGYEVAARTRSFKNLDFVVF